MTGDLSWKEKSNLQLVLEGINAGQWLHAMGVADAPTGTASGQIRIGGKADQPDGTMNLQLLRGTLNGREAVDRLQVQGSFTSSLFQIQGEIVATGSQKPVRITGKLPVRFSLNPLRMEIRQSDEMNASVKVDGLNAAGLLPYMDFLGKLQGTVDGEVIASGTFKQPVVKGSGSLRNGMFLVHAWPHPVENIQAEWRADARQLYVNKADVKLWGGRVSVQGRVDYPRFETMQWEAEGEDLDLPELYGLSGKISGKAVLTQNPEIVELTGNLRLSKAEMKLGALESDIARKNIEIDGDIEKNETLEIKSDEKSKNIYYNRLKMNVAVQLPPSGTWVRGKGLNAEITGALRLEKTPSSNMRLAGAFQTLRGTYTFQGNELKIASGELVFLGTPQPDPNLKIVCQKQVKDVTVQVMVTGPLSKPKLALSSTPSMNRVDILSYLLFDQPAGDLGSKEKGQLQDRAASWLGSETSNILRRVFGKSPLAPDTLRYRSARTTGSRSDTSSNKAEGGIIEIGKQITPDLSVTYGKGIMGEEGNQVQVEYRFNRHLSIQTQVGGADQSGVDVFWRHDFGK